ncbi:MAG: hypothetical protein ISN64_02915 [Rickettsia sp.]|nr:hypothetical protein [Rickettsia sp.]
MKIVNFYISKKTLLLVKYLIILFSCIYFTNVQSTPSSIKYHIKEIFASSTGNNAIEAKIKAQHKAFLMAFKILWDKQNIADDPLKNRIKYQNLKEIFKILNISEEKYMKNDYQAIFELEYDISKFYDFIFANMHNKSAIENSFYEYLLIVVNKKNEIFEMVNDKFAPFASSFYAKKIEDMRTYTPFTNNSDLLKKIYKIHFEQVEKLFHNILFKNIIVLTYEIFTNKQNMSSTLKINYLKINYNNHQNIKTSFIKIENENISNQNLFKKILDDFIKNYSSSKEDIKKTLDSKKNLKSYRNDNNKEEIIEKFKIYFTEQDTNIIETVKFKLNSINKDILDFSIDNSKKKYEQIINIKLKSSLIDLGEEFYRVGLSYVEKNGKYFLINISSGI